MQRLKKLVPVALFAVLSAAVSVVVGQLCVDRILEIERTQAARSRIQAKIHATVRSQYPGRIRDTGLRSRCGFTAYIVTVRQPDGGEYTLYYDIDNGEPIRQDLLNGCPGRAGGARPVRGPVTRFM